MHDPGFCVFRFAESHTVVRTKGGNGDRPPPWQSLHPQCLQRSHTASLCNVVVFWPFGPNRHFFLIADFDFPKMERSFAQPVVCLDKWFTTWFHFLLELIEVVFNKQPLAKVTWTTTFSFPKRPTIAHVVSTRSHRFGCSRLAHDLVF